MIDFSNKWKILSIGLMVILASGVAAPQAYALINQDILSIVQNIQSQVNNPTYGLKAISNKLGSQAAQTYGSKITSIDAKLLGVNGLGNATDATATSNHDFTVCFVFSSNTAQNIQIDDALYYVPAQDTISGCIGKPAGQSIHLDYDGNAGTLDGAITLTTTANSIASITTNLLPST